MVDDAHVDIHYLKSTSFREFSCEGVIGGPTPNGKIWLAFYNERLPLPRITRHKVREDVTGGRSLEMPGEVVESREGVIRAIEFGVYLSKEEAARLAEWLTAVAKDADREETSNE